VKELSAIGKMKDQEMGILRREKDELFKNHSLVMSERDNVHKEIDMLTEKLNEFVMKVLFLPVFCHLHMHLEVCTQLFYCQ